jgi:hypothetical protein
MVSHESTYILGLQANTMADAMELLGHIIDGADVTSPMGLRGKVCKGNSSFDTGCDSLKPYYFIGCITMNITVIS